MKGSDDAFYEAFKSKDTRFDGRFFVGISSTKIYCRPVCRAKQEKRENCTFFSSAAQAEAAGFRPCLLCRPELAPGNSVADARSMLVRKAADFLEENCGSGQNLPGIAGQLGLQTGICGGFLWKSIMFRRYNICRPAGYCSLKIF